MASKPLVVGGPSRVVAVSDILCVWIINRLCFQHRFAGALSTLRALRLGVCGFNLRCCNLKTETVVFGRTESEAGAYK